MRLIIEAPEEDMDLYIEEVSRQLAQGFTSGHVDSETHWAVAQEVGQTDA